MVQGLLALIAAAAVIGTPAWAGARLCGDDVGGADVPCGCGDTVVSDLILTNDPVATAVCPGDGLLVHAPDAGHGVKIDLSGHTLRGAGQGVGIWVLHGGPGGAQIVSTSGTATIEGFRDGLIGHGNDTVVLVDGIVLRNSGRDGLRVLGEHFEIRDTETRDSGRDGFSVTGSSFRLAATRAVGSKRYGYFVMGQDGIFGRFGEGNVSIGSGKSGFQVMGSGHVFVDCEAANSGEDGMRLMGNSYEVSACRTHDNHGDGISGMGTDCRFALNRAVDNGNDGIVMRGQRINDDGGNQGSGNRGEERKQQSPAVQCELGGAACVP